MSASAKPQFSSFKEYRSAYAAAVGLIVDRVPGVREQMLIMGSGPVSTMHLAHRQSWDVDLATKTTFADTKGVLKGFEKGFGKDFSYSGDRDLGIFQGTLRLPDAPPISVDILPAQHTFLAAELEPQAALSRFTCLSMAGYARIKAQTLSDRKDFKDIYDLAALANHPSGHDAVIRSLNRHCNKGALRQGIDMCRGLDHASHGLHLLPTGFRPVTEKHLESFGDQMETTLERKVKIDSARRESDRFDRIAESFSPAFG